MIIKIFAAVFILAANPNFLVKWSNPEATGLEVRVIGKEEVAKHCIKNGFAARVRFSVERCHKRSLWFDECKADRDRIHTIDYDSISEDYKLQQDILGDELDPVTVTYPKLDNILNHFYVFTLTDLPEANPKIDLIRVKAEMECKGEYNQTLSSLSYILTFGLVQISIDDTGWVTFDLASTS